MSEFRAIWQEQPHCYNRLTTNFVEAESEEIARAVVRDYIQRVHGAARFTIHSIIPYTRPEGHIL